MKIKERDVKERGWELLVSLFKIAKSDNKITPDEEAILKTTDASVMNLLDYVKIAWEDNILDQDERETIEGLVAKIEDDALTEAASDKIITEEEQNMLEVIEETIQGFFLQFAEFNFESD
ncbi:MAG: hypothetical protein IH840_13530 [Candidatus Heimdallarchaeota archaeon]|nr:hypothetical protein [Candidatus Heimdallarchaeota archaeon]